MSCLLVLTLSVVGVLASRNTSFLFYTPIVVTNANHANLSRALIELDTASMAATGKIQHPACWDVRFVDEKDSLLVFGLENACPSSKTRFWVEFANPMLPQSNTTIFFETRDKVVTTLPPSKLVANPDVGNWVSLSKGNCGLGWTRSNLSDSFIAMVSANNPLLGSKSNCSTPSCNHTHPAWTWGRYFGLSQNISGTYCGTQHLTCGFATCDPQATETIPYVDTHGTGVAPSHPNGTGNSFASESFPPNYMFSLCESPSMDFSADSILLSVVTPSAGFDRYTASDGYYAFASSSSAAQVNPRGSVLMHSHTANISTGPNIAFTAKYCQSYHSELADVFVNGGCYSTLSSPTFGTRSNPVGTRRFLVQHVHDVFFASTSASVVPPLFQLIPMTIAATSPYSPAAGEVFLASFPSAPFGFTPVDLTGFVEGSLLGFGDSFILNGGGSFTHSHNLIPESPIHGPARQTSTNPIVYNPTEMWAGNLTNATGYQSTASTVHYHHVNLTNPACNELFAGFLPGTIDLPKAHLTLYQRDNQSGVIVDVGETVESVGMDYTLLTIIVSVVGGVIILAVVVVASIILCAMICCCLAISRDKKKHEADMMGGMIASAEKKTELEDEKFKLEREKDQHLEEKLAEKSLREKIESDYAKLKSSVQAGVMMNKGSIKLVQFSEITLEKQLGSDPIGFVSYKGRWREMDVLVRVFDENLFKNKVINVFGALEDEVIEYSRYNNDSIVKYLAYTKPPKVAVVTEYCENGNLQDFALKNKSSLSLKTKALLLRGIADGMSYLHSMGVVHKDLCCKNIFVGKDNLAKIDIGFNRTFYRDYDSSMFAAPELVLGTVAPEDDLENPLFERFAVKCDVFSFSIIMYQLLTGRFDGKSMFGSAWSESIGRKVATDDDLRPELENSTKRLPGFYVNLLRIGWNSNPSERPSFQKIKVIIDSALDVLSGK